LCERRLRHYRSTEAVLPSDNSDGCITVHTVLICAIVTNRRSAYCCGWLFNQLTVTM